MGELLERYASLAYGEGCRIVATHRWLAERGLRPVPFETLALFSRSQVAQKDFAYTEFTADTPVGWFGGVDLLDGSPVYMPGPLVSLGYRAKPGEALGSFYATSSGCAVGTSSDAALLAGLLEVIERDAVMIRSVRFAFHLPGWTSMLRNCLAGGRAKGSTFVSMI